MSSYVAVLVDPKDLSPQSLPVLSASPHQAVLHIRQEHPSMQLHFLLDKTTMNRWRADLNTMNRSLDDGTNQAPPQGFVALMRQQDRLIAMPLLAPSLHAAVDYLSSHHPHQTLEGLVERTLLDRWVHNVEALEQRSRSPA